MTDNEWPTEDDLFEDSVSIWATYLDNPHVLSNCRDFLEKLWHRQFGLEVDRG